MTDWIIKLNRDKLLYLYFSPGILLALITVYPFHGNIDAIMDLLLIIFSLMFVMYVIITLSLGIKLINFDSKKIIITKLKGYRMHSFIDLTIISSISLILILRIFFEKIVVDYVIWLWISFFIMEAFRLITLSEIIVSLELKRKAKRKEYIATYYLFLNPIWGISNLYDRLKNFD